MKTLRILCIPLALFGMICAFIVLAPIAFILGDWRNCTNGWLGKYDGRTKHIPQTQPEAGSLIDVGENY